LDPNQAASVPSVELDRPTAALRTYEFDTLPAAHWHAQAAEEDSFISPRFLLRVLSQWWYIALPVAVLLAVVSAGLVMLKFTPMYRSTAVVKIAKYTPYIAYMSQERPMDPEEFTETQIELLRSPLVMEQVLAIDEVAELPELKNQSNPVAWLADRMGVTQVGNSELYSVRFDGPDPNNAALIVNSILDNYFAVRARDEESKSERVLELLAQEKEARSTEISRLREKMRELGKNVTGTDPITGVPTAKGASIGALDELRDRMVTAELDRKMLEMEITAIRETIDKKKIVVPEAQLEMAISESLEMQRLRSLIATKKEMLHRIENAAAAGKNDPSYLRLAREIDSYERSLANSAGKARPRIKEQLESMAALESKDLLAQLEAQLESKKVMEDLLQQRYQEQFDSASDSGGVVLELEFTRSELAREEKVFEMIAERSMALTTESRAPGRVTLLQPGHPPVGPIETIPLKNLALAILASGFLPFGLALVWELSIKRIADADQLSKQSALPVVGEIAKLPRRLQTLRPGGSRAMNMFEESVDSLRVGLVLPDQHQGVKVIAVTSATHGEGKSSISSQLAVSIGRSTGGPVLLIDGDLRLPDVHRIFNLPNTVGLATVLEGEATIDEAINTTFSEQLHVLPAGRLRKSPHKLMSVESLNQLLDELRPFYQYIVIDTPPVLSASEALLLCKVADGTVLSTRRNVSREIQVKRAHTRLMKAGARPMGAVFNGVPTRSYRQSYGSYDYSRNFE
jgi:capsular exopolysaccharide synthesis family protein